MPDGTTVAAVIDGMPEGLLTVIYKYYYENLRPSAIYDRSRPAIQQTLGEKLVYIDTDCAMAAKVYAAMETKFSPETQNFIQRAVSNAEDDKLYAVFRYILLAFKEPRDIDKYEQIGYVLRVHKLAKQTLNEAHLLKGFTRFIKTASGVFYADISPKNDVLPYLCEHFMDRLNCEKWVIHDVSRNTAGIFNTEECIITEVPPGIKSRLTEDGCDKDFQELWTVFYRTIGIQERKNSNLRRQNSPKRFWKHMTEHKLRFFDE